MTSEGALLLSSNFGQAEWSERVAVEKPGQGADEIFRSCLIFFIAQTGVAIRVKNHPAKQVRVVGQTINGQPTNDWRQTEIIAIDRYEAKILKGSESLTESLIFCSLVFRK